MDCSVTTLANLATQIDSATYFLQRNIPYMLYIIAVLYGIHFLNWLVGYRLNILGIYPRQVLSLPGIFFSPCLHGSFNHLFFNTIPLFALGCFVLVDGWPNFISATVMIVFIGGLGTWFFGRKGFHVGASGLIMGYWSYLLVNAYYQPTMLSIALALVCLYYFGGMLFNLFPTAIKASWEAHLFGFLGGLAAAYANPYVMNYLGFVQQSAS